MPTCTFHGTAHFLLPLVHGFPVPFPVEFKGTRLRGGREAANKGHLHPSSLQVKTGRLFAELQIAALFLPMKSGRLFAIIRVAATCLVRRGMVQVAVNFMGKASFRERKVKSDK
jgi:hypothetical protein